MTATAEPAVGLTQRPLWMDLVCERCGKEFRRKRSDVKSTRTFCSQQCWLKTHNTPERNRKAARKGRHANRAAQIDRFKNPETRAANRAAQIDSGEGKTYRKFYGRHEHRVVAERALGRALRPGEIVHHRNEDKRDNRVENLFVFASQAEHARHHHLLRLGRAPELPATITDGRG